MIMYVVKAGLLVALVFMVISPKLFFQWLDRYLFEEQPVEQSVPYVSNSTSMQMDSVGLEREESQLENIQKMIDSAKNPDVRRIWTLKREEFTRNTKWRRLTEYSAASERVAHC